MRVSRLSNAEAAQLAVKTLGLDQDAANLLSPEGLCASLRRAASFLCPATPRQVVDAALDALTPLDTSASLTRNDLMDQLDLLIASGDLLELRQRADPEAERETRQLFLGPPSYVTKMPDTYLLLGVRPHGAALVDDTLGAEVMHEGHTRTIGLDADIASERLRAAGLHEIGRDQWLRHPRRQAASEFLDEHRQRLSSAGPAGEIEGLTLIDPSSSVRYYRGRWRKPKVSDSGDFVARRPQAYGADLWCLVRIEEGQPKALVDLPVVEPVAPGHDEAWRLQAALDAERGQPQVVRIRRTAHTGSSEILDLFAPVPGWAERYLELVGLPVPRSRGSLFSYRLPTAVIAELTQFLTDMLWLSVSDEGETH